MLSSDDQSRTNAFSRHRMTEPLSGLGKAVGVEALVKPSDMLNGLLPGVMAPSGGHSDDDEPMGVCVRDDTDRKQDRTVRNGLDADGISPDCSSRTSHLAAPPTPVKSEPVNCGECLKHFTDIRSYMDHVCSKNQDLPDDNHDLLSDGESFDGKIIYNRDGSAYIIEGQSDSSDAESLLDASQLEGSIVDEHGKTLTSQLASVPQIANAVYIHRNPAMFYNPLYMLSEKSPQHLAPIMHNYRVYDVRSKSQDETAFINGNNSDAESCDSDDAPAMSSKSLRDNDDVAALTVPTKPILMCFKCKLSFGYAKSFVAHAISEHAMVLNSAEKRIIAKKNASAIIQGGGKDKLPLMSFLEPTSTSSHPTLHNKKTDPSGASETVDQARTTAISHDSINDAISSPSSSSSSLSVSPATNSLSTTAATKPAIYEHSDDSRSSCESVETMRGSVNTQSSRCPKRDDDEGMPRAIALPGSDADRPNSNGVESARITPSPDSDSPRMHLEAMQCSSEGDVASSVPLLFSSSNPNSMPVRGIVIRAGCEEHPHGNISGIGCSKCDVVAGSTRSFLGNGASPVALMHSRNSCKTLKCPKCNWHYKYQETLEIHMKEKHLEGDTQCIYCITNQAHPRLARGEVYNCGYKPYRCDVCNYSTTTKGNLSIHMQSDKHINNMQELQQAQQPASDAVVEPTPLALPAPPVAEMPPSSGAVTPPAAPDAAKKNKMKPMWRCDVCNYETNVARNLRIHMTSEKHTHNMLVLQQNMNHMQRDMQFQLSQMAYMVHDPNMLMSLPGGGAISMPAFPTTLDQAVMMSSLGGGVTPGGSSLLESPVDLSKQENGLIVSAHDALLHPMDLKNNNEPTQLFQCGVCDAFSSNSVEVLHQHMTADRSKESTGGDGVMVVGGTYMCNLCHYKTNLKANFQLHCKTDKHLQRLQLVNHIREGGPANQWRLKDIATHITLPVQVRCHACDYLTNDTHKLQLHTATPQHEAAAKLFGHLLANEASIYGGRDRYYRCTLCDYMARTKLTLIRHTRSAQHVHAENERIHQLREEGKLTETTAASLISEIFVVNKCANADDIKFDDEDVNDLKRDVSSKALALDVPSITPRLDDSGMTIKKEPAATSTAPEPMSPFCNFPDVGAVESNMRAHHATHDHATHDECTVVCPLCQEKFQQRGVLESHLVEKHNVTQEGMQRLMLIVDQIPVAPTTVAKTTPPPRLSSPSATVDMTDAEKQESMENEVLKLAEEASKDGIVLPDKDGSTLAGDDLCRCHMCSMTFINIDALCTHQNEQGHLELKDTPRGPGYLCWKKGCNQYFKSARMLQVHFSEIHAKRPHVAVSERHIYKFRCNQCSLAFKTLDKLQLHSYYHVIRAATKCSVCGRNFRSVAAMHKHIETTHLDGMSAAEVEAFRSSVAATTAVLPNHIEASAGGDTEVKTEPEVMEVLLDSSKPATDGEDVEMSDTSAPEVAVKKEDPSVSGADYKEQHFLEDYINSEAIAENSYADPTRKYKCHRCKVAFTKQSYLSAHNKTLMHRRGDKLSYPMEKYLDPNRPFKCDVCKESFTQKNILLVHYNSVSHLHKLKQQQGQSTSPSLPDQAPLSPKATSATPTVPLALPSPSVPLSPQQISPVGHTTSDGLKPYKCNICKVSYSQSSTLDIHRRSVLHQTRASKLQDLALTGQLDLSQPLIEQPDVNEQRHKKVLQEMLQQRHSSSSTAVTQSPVAELPHHAWTSLLNLPSVSSPGEPSSDTGAPSQSVAQCAPVISRTLQSPVMSMPFSPPPAGLLSPHQPVFMCPKCGSIFGSQETLGQHQKMYCYMSQASGSSGAPQRSVPRFKPHVQRSLLQNIGFECVMQFNEYFQKKLPPKKEQPEAKESKEETSYKDKESEKENDQNAENKHSASLPEINKRPCGMCGKVFSSVWVLKAHQEEVHQDIVPIKYVEQFSETFREQYEKKQQLAAAAETVSAVESPGEVAKTTALQTAEKTQKAAAVAASSLAASLASMAQTSAMIPMPMFNMMPMGMPLNMNMAPPLMPIMMPLGAEMFGLPGMDMMDPMFRAMQQQQQQQAAAASTALSMAQQYKRARTRINDEQLKILRGHFDINNSPSEEQILSMAEKSGLPPKVIKHWFRNTLFKERQRNKDSPYNFSVPPATTLNIEEYEKTCTIPDEAKFLHSMIPEVTPPSREVKKERTMDVQEEEAVMSGAESIVSSSPSTPAPCVPMSAASEGVSAFTSIVPSTSASLGTPQMISSPSILHSPLSSASMAASMSANMASSSMLGKRANRTRFSDYQIKVLQDNFDHNAYPKDDDIEHMSRLLNLGSRIIVVWFQNMRQKARKTYENQPLLDSTSNDGTRYSRTPGLNYQCKKCQTVFQRYYELIKHQKMYCFKDEDRDDDDDMSGRSPPTSMKSEGSMDSIPDTPDVPPMKAAKSESVDYKCEQCSLVFDHFDEWRKHQAVHSVNQNMFDVAFPPDSAFAMLQTVAAQQQQRAAQELGINDESVLLYTSSKHKLEEDSDDLEDDQPKDKRLRTTILPEQLDYLYLKYQMDCNPSRKQLEAISHDVALKKRVVQVWFQNTRARERKGQYRVHQQLIHKRCPLCRALFRAKSAMESHLATKHPEEMAKGELNVDDIPDAAFDITSVASSSTPMDGIVGSPTAAPSISGLDVTKLLTNPYNMSSQFMPLMLGVPPGGGSGKPLEANMQKLYEDSLKTYLDELRSSAGQTQEVDRPRVSPPDTVERLSEETPLDLSQPLKPPHDEHNASGLNLDDSFSETHSESMENSSPSSPGGSITSQQSTPQQPGQPLTPNSLKRYRTHMSEQQIGVMKAVCGDYKTPTMGECEILGREIGLPKRVVQVWFQNARAKEKKARLAYLKAYGKEMVVPEQRLPDECTLCRVHYTHKYTMQDHIFTKKHIALMSKSLQVKTSPPAAGLVSPPGAGQVVKTESVVSKKWQQVEPPTTTPHLSQLYSMGLQAMATTATVTASKASETPNKSQTSSKTKTHEDKKELSKTLTELPVMPGVGPFNAASLPPMMNPFGSLPMMNPMDLGMAAAASAGMFSFMYPGMGMMYPGMGGMGMPMMPPVGMMPGAESMYMCDPMTFGTPLTLMQIPGEAIRDIECKLQEAGCTIARYTQDCMMLCDLTTHVSAADTTCAREAMVDVGYICKKCHMVYPARDACVNHQRMLCYQSEPDADPAKSILKLEQIQYECCACSVKFSSISDYKTHCEQDGHKAKVLGGRPGGATVKSDKGARNELQTQTRNPGEKSSSESNV